jgi:hypothetical protein
MELSALHEALGERLTQALNENADNGGYIQRLETTIERKNSEICDLQELVAQLKDDLRQEREFYRSRAKEQLQKTERNVRKLVTSFLDLHETVSTHSIELETLLEERLSAGPSSSKSSLRVEESASVTTEEGSVARQSAATATTEEAVQVDATEASDQVSACKGSPVGCENITPVRKNGDRNKATPVKFNSSSKSVTIVTPLSLEEKKAEEPADEEELAFFVKSLEDEDDVHEGDDMKSAVAAASTALLQSLRVEE